MAEGGTWSGTYTVSGEAAGWYRVMANAYTHGPDGGSWLFDDVLREAWMHVDETDGQLTRILEDSVAPVAGPAAGWPTGAGPARSPDRPFWDPDSVYLHVVYSVSEREGFQPAVEAWVNADYKDARGRDAYHGQLVPEDGIVVFGCNKAKNRSFRGDVEAPETDLVQRRDDIARWETNALHCGTLVEVEVLARRYYPWRLLNLAADTLTRHFGHTRGRVSWQLHFEQGRGASYNGFPFRTEITLPWLAADTDRFRWTVAHEYGHALHHKALGGIWWRSPNCSPHSQHLPSSYECALKEGFADYAGAVGSVTADYPDGFYGECYEYLGTPNAPSGWCRHITHERKPEIEAWIAALFNDLIDDNDNYEGIDDYYLNDETHYSGYYVAGVFKSCEAKRGRWPDRWKDRSKVYDFVWCLEEYVHKPTHERVFPNTGVPDTAKHERPPNQPKNWDPFDIRSAWLRNLAEEGK